MVEQQRKGYKTKLCVLYERGRCARPSCSFAHGEAELRRFDDVSSHGTRDYGVDHLRERFDRSYSPKRGEYLLEKGRRTLRDENETTDYSPSKSLEKESKRRKRQHPDNHSDYSGSMRTQNEPEEESKDARSVYQKRLQVVQSELKKVEQHRSQLEVYLGERSQEVDSLTSKIQELEAQLYKEKEECKRISHKVKKFVKAHSHHSRIQDQLQRSHIRLNKLGDQLGLDTCVTDANEEDTSINIVSDGETDFPVTLHKKKMFDSPPIKERLDLNTDPAQEPKQAPHSTRRLERLSRWKTNPAQSDFVNVNGAMNSGNGNGRPRLVAKDNNNDRRKAASSSFVHADVLKSLESEPAVPSTSMAAHAVDTEIDIELDSGLENDDISSRKTEGEPTYEGGDLHRILLPPPPPFRTKNVSQHENSDKIVDIVNGVE